MKTFCQISVFQRSSDLIVVEFYFSQLLFRSHVSKSLGAHLKNMTPLKLFLLKAGNMVENLYLYVLSNSISDFCFKAPMATNSKMAAIGLRKILLAIYIKQFLAIHQWNVYKGFIRHQKCFRFIIIDIKTKMAT